MSQGRHFTGLGRLAWRDFDFASQYTGYSVKLLREAAKRGELRAEKNHRRWRTTIAALDEWMRGAFVLLVVVALAALLLVAVPACAARAARHHHNGRDRHPALIETKVPRHGVRPKRRR